MRTSLQIRENVDAMMRVMWLEARNGLDEAGRERFDVSLSALVAAGAISDLEADGWRYRVFSVCPGHDDEGGQSWCAYCGNMPREFCSITGLPVLCAEGIECKCKETTDAGS